MPAARASAGEDAVAAAARRARLRLGSAVVVTLLLVGWGLVSCRVSETARAASRRSADPPHHGLWSICRSLT